MAQIFWEQIRDTLPSEGTYLTGSLNVSGSFGIFGDLAVEDGDIILNTGSIVIDGTNILDNFLFKKTGSFWATTNDVQITGSLGVNLDGIEDEFIISTAGEEKVKINTDGVLQLKEVSTLPTPLAGGIVYSGSNEFYFGFT